MYKQRAAITSIAARLRTDYPRSGASEVTAGMYPAPYWSPPNVGHTYYTYQPLMPHEHMYEHIRTYYQYYGGPGAFYQDPCRGTANQYGLNKTTVVWQNGASHVGTLPFKWDCFHCLGNRCAIGGNCSGCGQGQCAGGAGCASGSCQ